MKYDVTPSKKRRSGLRSPLWPAVRIAGIADKSGKLEKHRRASPPPNSKSDPTANQPLRLLLQERELPAEKKKKIPGF